MKTKQGASGLLKQVVSLVISVVKAKTRAVKSKASAVKTRLIIFGLLRNKKVLMSAVSHKIHALLGHHQQDNKLQCRGGGDEDDDHVDVDGGVDGDDSKAIVLYKADDPEAALMAARRGMVVAETTTTSPMGTNYIGGGGHEYEEAAAEEEEDDDDEGRYPDLRHSLFDEEDEWYLQGDDGSGSVVELVRNLRGQEEGEFVLEDEIDHVADAFIRRFHRQIRMQKLESFKRFQEMMERSV